MAEEIKKPVCVGMIMDGNRRWAKQRGLDSFEGHKMGYSKVKDAVDWCLKEKIPNLILYACSKDEVSYLMGIINMMISKDISSLKKKGIRVSFIGELSMAEEDIRELIKKAETESKELKKLHLVIAFSYGGRREILNTVKEISKIKSKEEIENLSEEEFSKFLWTGSIGVPDPDLIIRTGGEMRLSNFLTWQSTYSELFFLKMYWPDFNYEEFKKILEEFALRDRRFGQ